jgi:hypothetical protein
VLASSYRISSISNAARMVSIRTVARTEPRGADRRLGVDEDVVPKPGLEVALELGQVEAAGSAGEASAASWNRNSPASNRLADIGRPSTSTWRLEVPAARPDDQRRRGVVEPVGLVRRVEGEGRRTASAIVTWPPITFAQVGLSASSRSAMKTRAPELSALIIILVSAGP